MESGTPGIKVTEDGWLNRALQDEKITGKPSAFRAVALGTHVPRTLQGKLPAIAIANLNDFSVAGKGAADDLALQRLPGDVRREHGRGTAWHGAGDLRGGEDAEVGRPGEVSAGGGRGVSKHGLRQQPEADRAVDEGEPGREAAFSDIGGWDTHQNQGAANGQLAGRLREFSESIAAFWKDMGADSENITLVTMSEFGRTARQNGTGGTDHGHANVMFVLGGTVKGGKVYGKWPGLSNEQLNEGRDLTVTTDFRRVLGEAAYKTLGALDMEKVFPGARVVPGDFLNFV